MTLRRGRRSLIPAFVVIGVLAAVMGFGFNYFMPQGIGFLPEYVANPLWKPVSVSKAKILWDQGAGFIDARDPGNYKLGRMKKAVNLYPEEFDIIYPLLSDQLRPKKTIVVYGRSQSRFPAADIAQRLIKDGFKNVLVMQGTIENWQEAGYPVRVPRKRKSS